MAKNNAPMARSLAIERLTRQRNAIDQLSRDTSAGDFVKWKRDTEVVIRNVFPGNHGASKEFAAIRYDLSVWFDGTPDSAWKDACDSGLRAARALLDSMIQEVQEYWDAGPDSTGPAVIPVPVRVIAASPASEDVFVVHGHNDMMKQAVCRTLEKLGLHAIVLHEKPNRGRTIIEKFSDYSSVGFAVVLLSADDEGCERGQQPRPRPRQNVLFELGFFIGKLGRERVMALSDDVPNLELPSDYAGVVFTPFDGPGHWRLELVIELKAAGFAVDANKLLT